MSKSICFLIACTLITACSPDSRRNGNGDNTVHVHVAQMPSQQVGRLTIKYPYQFTGNDAESGNMKRGLPADFQDQVNLAVYNSQPTCGLGEVRLVVANFVPGAPLDIDGSAAGVTHQVSMLEGITNPEVSVESATVSEYPARRISYQAHRWGGVLALEALIIADMQSNTAWQLQFISGAKGTSDYAKLNRSRACADEIMDYVSIAP